jgi:hypothetical protein
MTESLDIDCAMNLLAKQAAEIAQKTGASACLFCALPLQIVGFCCAHFLLYTGATSVDIWIQK